MGLESIELNSLVLAFCSLIALLHVDFTSRDKSSAIVPVFEKNGKFAYSCPLFGNLGRKAPAGIKICTTEEIDRYHTEKSLL